MTTTLSNTNYKPVLPVMQRLYHAPAQEVITELATALQEIYRINHNGGHGSRRQVADLLVKLGIQPN